MPDHQILQCPGCGAAVITGKDDCEYCGTRIKWPSEEVKTVQKVQIVQPASSVTYIPAQSISSKSKTAAVLLAVFLGFWGWVYTWELDRWKFWVGLGVTIVTLGYGYIVILIWAIIDSAVRTSEFYLNYPNRG